MKKIVILGSTGSIGTSLINIIKKDKKNFKIELISANKNYKKIIKQAKLFNIQNLIITNQNSFIKAKKILNKSNIKIFNDFNSLNKILKNKNIDYTMNAIVGLDGLLPTLKIINHTKKIAIANKESIICGWNLIKNKLRKYNTKFIPIDSEHFSIWSLLNKSRNIDIENIYITASGGPFLNYPTKKFKFISLKSALNHPTWKMGRKISIDSATMMNKVFEIIEAKKIFDIQYNKLKILIHPKSYVHAVIKFKNGLIKILAHDTDMTIPIFNSIYPKLEKKIKTKKIDFVNLNNLKFQNIDKNKFPLVKVLDFIPPKDSLFETILVSANDKIVNLFLNKKIKFFEISKFLLMILSLKEFQKYKKIKPKSIKQIVDLNKYVSIKIDSLSV
tara:strand:- start:852 stop:2015 length:1164 start_codon:yes stop_codon:yes gene_type:complete